MSSNMMTSMLSGFNNYSKMRMSGLASGMDTQGTIDAMTMASKNRVVKQWSQIESLKWTQNAFRSQIGIAKTFKDTFFNTLKPETNMGSVNMFNAFKATSSGGVKVNPTATTSISRVEITEILSKATASELKSESGFDLTKDIAFSVADIDALKAEMANGGNKMQVNIDGSVKTITLEGTTADEIIASLATGINKAYGTNKVNIGTDGKLTVTGKSQITMAGAEYVDSNGKIHYGDELMKEIGMDTKNVSSNKIDRYSKLGNAAFTNALKGDVFEFSINGTDFKFNKSNTIADIMNGINNSTSGARMTYSSIEDTFTLTAASTGSGNTLDIKETSGNLFESLMGYKDVDGASISTNNLNSTDINGVNVSANPRLPVADILEKGLSLTINGVTKNIYLPTYSANGDKINYLEAKDTDPYQVVAKQLNEQIRKEFGTKDVNFEYVSNTEMKLVSSNKDAVSIKGIVTGQNPDGTDIVDNTLYSSLGFSDTGSMTNVASQNKTLADALGITGPFTINNGGRTVTLSGTNTVKKLVEILNENGNNVTFDTTTGRLTANLPDSVPPKKISGGDAAGTEALKKLFGTDVIEQSVYNPATDPLIKSGTNAKLTINGSTIERNSNVFSLNGVDIDITDAKIFSETAVPPDPAIPGDTGIPEGSKIVIDISRNTDATFDAIKKFADEYNKMITSFSLATSKKGNRDYGPLTDEQKEAMSEGEIEKWEAKAKEGLLYNDKDINSLTSQLRSAMYSKPVNAPFALYDIGVTTGDFKNGGMLIIDEAKLKKALGENPEGVSALFTDKTDGLAVKVTKIMDTYVKDFGVDKGILVTKAGIKDSPTEDKNFISEQIVKYNDKLKTLQKRYADEQERLWKTFTAMEKNIASLNSQGSSISAMFGGGAAPQ